MVPDDSTRPAADGSAASRMGILAGFEAEPGEADRAHEDFAAGAAGTRQFEIDGVQGSEGRLGPGRIRLGLGHFRNAEISAGTPAHKAVRPGFFVDRQVPPNPERRNDRADLHLSLSRSPRHRA